MPIPMKLSMQNEPPTRTIHVLPGLFWLFHGLTLVALAAWAYLDPEFTALVNHGLSFLRFTPSGHVPIQTGEPLLNIRLSFLAGAVVFSVITWLVLLIGAVIGPMRLRSFSAWFMLLTLAALWMIVATNWAHVARLGKLHRMHSGIEDFERIAIPLQESWPRTDGDLPGLGPFMAYPAGKPSVLILLTQPLPSEDRPSISAVERGVAGQLRFQLAGKERGHWLEWHPPGSQPASFVGGLLEVYELERADAVADQWYLTKYRNSVTGYGR